MISFPFFFKILLEQQLIEDRFESWSIYLPTIHHQKLIFTLVLPKTWCDLHMSIIRQRGQRHLTWMHWWVNRSCLGIVQMGKQLIKKNKNKNTALQPYESLIMTSEQIRRKSSVKFIKITTSLRSAYCRANINFLVPHWFQSSQALLHFDPISCRHQNNDIPFYDEWV